MIECIFTVDYEIYGNGTGSLKDLVYAPAERLRGIFQKWNVRFVNFVEVAEFEKIEAWGTDSAIDLVKRQIRELHDDGFETGLHLHPQWCHARFDQGRWFLDDSEYNLCTLSRGRIDEIVGGAIEYLRQIVGQSDFTPLSFRAGNWLFQPTQTAGEVLARHGIRIDTSVFKGGLQHNHQLDYRCSLRNGYAWRFTADANEPDPTGALLEVPIFTEMVPMWKMGTSKRLSFGNSFGATTQTVRKKLNRLRDFLRILYPLKFDFCRLTLDELTSMMGRVIAQDRVEPESYKPIVAIGHTKDLSDPQTVDAFLTFLNENGIPVSTFEASRQRLLQASVPVLVTRS